MELLTIVLAALAIFAIVWVVLILLGILILSVGASEGRKYGDLNDIQISDKREEPRARGITQQKNKR